MTDVDLHRFATQLVQLKLKETDLAVALIWYQQRLNPEFDTTAGELARLMGQLGLVKSAINTGRLSSNLHQHPATAKGRSIGRYRIG